MNSLEQISLRTQTKIKTRTPREVYKNPKPQVSSDEFVVNRSYKVKILYRQAQISMTTITQSFKKSQQNLNEISKSGERKKSCTNKSLINLGLSKSRMFN